MALEPSRNDHFPTDFRRLVARASATGVRPDSAEVSMVVSLFRPFAVRDLEWYCSYSISLDGRVVASDSGPGADGASALFMGLSGLALAVESLKREHHLTWRGHDMWWVAHLTDR